MSTDWHVVLGTDDDHCVRRPTTGLRWAVRGDQRILQQAIQVEERVHSMAESTTKIEWVDVPSVPLER